MASEYEDQFKILKMIHKDLLAGDPQIIGVFVGMAVVIITILYFLLCGRKNKRNGVLLVGLCDSGKTLLWSRLVNKKFVNSHTSIRDNCGIYKIPDHSKTLRLFDLPGHERTRSKFIDSYKDNARGVIFVVDSTTIQKEIKDAAEFLYNILSDGVFSYNAPPVLVACNKHDQTFAKSSKVVQDQLEKEMNTLRVTRSAQLESTEGTGNNNTFLGKRNKDFEFGDLRPFKVEFVECSGRGQKDENEEDLEGIKNWLNKIA
ncbi:signal recognition particle receptor subunit beta-like isoform X1 [Lineus longissimus]|uniref:signal recognition particle receptor subunit beta-like isoform X1 n=1 Tax=Lineus longissimus TaxID=88925 RepID=UPI002B4D6C7B